MEKRTVIEWDKDDLDTLEILKVDVLGLGMLSCLRRGFELIARHYGLRCTLDSVPEGEEAVYNMLSRADSIGVFQVESRAQMSMLPRLKPRTYYDLVVQVAIVRPGPIQGDMVHPYLKRREGLEKVEYPNDALAAVLRKTLGVPLFQEQAMQVAIIGAGFSPGEADQLRRAMATFKMTGGVGPFRDRLIKGMRKNGITQAFAERLVKQIEGFGSYGFPESHAASFAKIAYASSWMKCHHPDVFCAALLNAQPMGFYAPAQIVRDARAHGVVIRPVCVMESEWDTSLMGLMAPPTLPPSPRTLLPLRLGLRVVHGLSGEDAGRILTARAERRFSSVDDLWRRSGVPLASLEKLAKADAFAGLGLDRRQALWAIRGLGEKPLPLFAGIETREASVTLTRLTEGREVVEDYRAMQLSLRAHPLRFLRGLLSECGMVPCDTLEHRNGTWVEVAGIILVRQRPGSAKGVLFLTIEDETGVANGILWPDRFEAQRRTVMSSAMVSLRGRVQKEGKVTHVIVDRVTDLTPMLRTVGDIDLPRLTAPADGVTSGGTPDARDPQWRPPVRSDYHFRDRAEPAIPIKSHDFH